MGFETVVFYLLATLSVVTSLLVIGQRNPVYSVMLLIASFASLAGLYILLDAPFTAVTQIIVYAGAIMVLFLFVVMLLNVGAGGRRRVRPVPPVQPALRAAVRRAARDRVRRGDRLGRVARDHAAAGGAGAGRAAAM